MEENFKGKIDHNAHTTRYREIHPLFLVPGMPVGKDNYIDKRHGKIADDLGKKDVEEGSDYSDRHREKLLLGQRSRDFNGNVMFLFVDDNAQVERSKEGTDSKHKIGIRLALRVYIASHNKKGGKDCQNQ